MIVNLKIAFLPMCFASFTVYNLFKHDWSILIELKMETRKLVISSHKMHTRCKLSQRYTYENVEKKIHPHCCAYELTY